MPLSAKRIVRSRYKRQPLPEGAIYVGRPTLWGNPFQGRQWGHAKSVLLHARWLNCKLGDLSLERMNFSLGEIEALTRLRERVLSSLDRIVGHDLACWCPLNSRWCHADTLLDFAKRRARNERLSA